MEEYPGVRREKGEGRRQKAEEELRLLRCRSPISLLLPSPFSSGAPLAIGTVPEALT
jgi:hypothetical protein